jgi:hypothetical protein
MKYIREIIIIILLIVILLLVRCQDKPIEYRKIIPVEKTIFKKGKDIHHVKVKSKFIHDTVKLTKLDTIRIVEAYNSMNIYKDTLNFDSLGYVNIIDTIYKNELWSRSVKSKINTFETIKILNPNKLFIGLDLGVNYIGTSALLTLPKYSIRAGVGYNGHFNFNIGLYYKLWSK